MPSRFWTYLASAPALDCYALVVGTVGLFVTLSILMGVAAHVQVVP